MLAGLAALSLYVLWSVIDPADVSFVAYLTRAISFVAVGALTGQMADRLRTTADAAATAARHLELTRDLFCTANLDGYLVELHGPWTKTLGWTEAELRSKPFVEFVHPDDRERTRDPQPG